MQVLNKKDSLIIHNNVLHIFFIVLNVISQSIVKFRFWSFQAQTASMKRFCNNSFLLYAWLTPSAPNESIKSWSHYYLFIPLPSSFHNNNIYLCYFALVDFLHSCHSSACSSMLKARLICSDASFSFDLPRAFSELPLPRSTLLSPDVPSANSWG